MTAGPYKTPSGLGDKDRATRTSRRAATDAAENAERRRQEILALIRQSPNGLSCTEIATARDEDESQVRPRVSDLYSASLIEAHPTEKRPTKFGKPSTVWCAVGVHKFKSGDA